MHGLRLCKEGNRFKALLSMQKKDTKTKIANIAFKGYEHRLLTK